MNRMKELQEAFINDGDFEVSDLVRLNEFSSAFIVSSKTTGLDYIIKDRAGFGEPSENIHIIVDICDSWTVMELDKRTLEERARRVPNDASHVSVMEIERVARNAREAINAKRQQSYLVKKSNADCSGKKYKVMKSFCSMQMFV